MYNPEDGKYTVYRVYSDQQAHDGWVSHNDYGVYSSFMQASDIVDDLLEEERGALSKRDLQNRKETSTAYSVEVENGLYAWQTYYIKKYVLDEFIEDDRYTEDPPRHSW
jgi:hypothetical protein